MAVLGYPRKIAEALHCQAAGRLVEGGRRAGCAAARHTPTRGIAADLARCAWD